MVLQTPSKTDTSNTGPRNNGGRYQHHPHPSLLINIQLASQSEDVSTHAYKLIKTSIARISLRKSSENHISPSGKYLPRKYYFYPRLIIYNSNN